jgi:predicted phage baseplate assembly protein
VPVPQLSIGFLVAPRGEAPPPVSAGGLFLMPGTEPPRVSWELFVDGAFVEAEVIRDETASFTQSGIVELRVPDGWRPGVPPGADPAQPLYWIRSQLLDGAWPDAPALSFVGLNMVRAMSGRTVRDEIVDTPITLDPAQRQVLKLADSPVLDGTLRVSIDEGGSELVAWKAVPDLSGVGPDERAFVFDPARGTLTFGSANGTNGRPLPEGFRHVHASYRVAVTATKVAAGAISTLVGSAAFLTSVTNLDPATGGRDTETLDEALVRGPREIRARERAVAVADYEVLALASPGADIRRAHAVGGLHPRFPGRPVPGVVAVFVVGAPRDDGQPPVPNDATLHAVSEHLSTCAPRGAEVVATAPTFHSIRVEASLDIRRDADVTATAHEVSQLLDTWFDPVRGGADGQGWPFGGAVRYDAVVRFLLERLGGRLIAIPDLRFVVDTRRSRPCEDVAIPEHDLLWPAPHELVPVPRRPS